MARPFLVARLPAARSAVVAELSPRERLLRLGAAALSDAELLSVVLRIGTCDAPALGLAVDLLRRVGGFPGFLRLDADSFRALGLSRRQAAALVSTLELSRRLTRDELPRRLLLDEPEAVVRYAAARYLSPDQQILAALFLDPCCRLITDCEIFRGGLTGAAVDPGPVFRRALAASAASVVVLQTRCGGEPTPTAHDWAFTRRLVDAGKTLGIGLCDHLIVASAERWVSLQRRKPW